MAKQEQSGRFSETEVRIDQQQQRSLSGGGLIEVWQVDSRVQATLRNYPFKKINGTLPGIEDENLYERTTRMGNFYENLAPKVGQLAEEGGVKTIETFLGLNREQSKGRIPDRRGEKSKFQLIDGLQILERGVVEGIEYRLIPSGEAELFDGTGRQLQDVVVEITGVDPRILPVGLARLPKISPILVVPEGEVGQRKKALYKALFGEFVKAVANMESAVMVTSDPQKVKNRDMRIGRTPFCLKDVLVRGGMGDRFEDDGGEGNWLTAHKMDGVLEQIFSYWQREGSSSMEIWSSQLGLEDPFSGNRTIINTRKGGRRERLSDLAEAVYLLKRYQFLKDINRVNRAADKLSETVTEEVRAKRGEAKKIVQEATEALHGSWVYALMNAWRQGYDQPMAKQKLLGA